MPIPDSQDVYSYLEGYGISKTNISPTWIQKRISNLVIPWIEGKTRLVFDAEKEVTEYLSGTGKEILMLSKRPVNSITSIRYVRSTGAVTDLTNSIELSKEEGMIISRNNPSEGQYLNMFEKGNKNIAVTYKYGQNDFVDPNNNRESVDIKEAIVYISVKQVLIQMGARTGGGSLTVQAHGRNYGGRGKYTDIINNLDMMAYEILKRYFTGVAGS